MPTQIYSHLGLPTAHSPAHPTSAHLTKEALLHTLETEARKRVMAQYCNIPPDPRYVDIMIMDRVNRGVAASDVSLERRGHWVSRESGNAAPRDSDSVGDTTPIAKDLKMAGPYVDLRATTRPSSRSSKRSLESAKSTDRDVSDLARRLGSVDIELYEVEHETAIEHHRPSHRTALTRRMSVATSRPARAPEMVRTHTAPPILTNDSAMPGRSEKRGGSQARPRRSSIAGQAPRRGASRAHANPISPVLLCAPVYVEITSTAIYPVDLPVSPIVQASMCYSLPGIQQVHMGPTPMMGPLWASPCAFTDVSSQARVRQWRAGMELEDRLDDVLEEGTLCDADCASSVFDDVGSSISKRADDQQAGIKLVHSQHRRLESQQPLSDSSRHPSRMTRAEWTEQQRILLTQ